MNEAVTESTESSPGQANASAVPLPVLRVRKPLFRAGIIAITLSSVAWLASYLMLAADRSGGMFGRFGLFVLCAFAFLVMVATWFSIATSALVTKRRLGLIGWAVLPLTLAIAWVPPWSSWLFDAQFKAAEPTLRGYAESCLQAPPDKLPSLGTSLHGFEFVSSSVRDGSVYLTRARSPDGEFGMVFCPSHALPDPSNWAVRNRYSPIAADWWHYNWSNE